MKIGVISDTHGNIHAWNKALPFLKGADLIVHAGDVLYHPLKLGCMEGYDVPALLDAFNTSEIPIVIAQGNCDAQVYEGMLNIPVQSPYAFCLLNGTGLLISHGHLLSRDQMIALGRSYKAKYFISGHTHIPTIDDLGDLVLMNPGSPSIPRFEVDGKPVPSIGIITEDGARIVNIDNGTELMRSSL